MYYVELTSKVNESYKSLQYRKNTTMCLIAHIEADFEPERPGFTVYTAPADNGLLFISPPKRSIFTPQSVTDYCGVV